MNFLKTTGLGIVLLLLVSCNNSGRNSANTPAKTELKQADCDFQHIKTKILENEKSGIEGIAENMHYINACIEKFTSEQKDSIFILFYKTTYLINSMFNDSLSLKKYRSLMKKLETNANNIDAKNFKKRVDSCGLQLSICEKSYFTVIKPDLYTTLFKDKVSPAFWDFAKTRNTEEKDIYTKDGSLVISFEQLYSRILIWENFIKKYPDFPLMNEVQANYYEYLAVLLIGTDNTPTFDSETHLLQEDVKKLYAKISKKTDGNNSTRLVSKYYYLLQARNFKKPEGDMYKYFRETGLNAMLGIK